MKPKTDGLQCRPGVEVIEKHIGNIYKEINTKSEIKERFDLCHGLSHVEVCAHPGDIAQDIPAHWHYISYGLSQLDWDADREQDETTDEPSGFGFELTFRLKREPDETKCPKWPVYILLAFAEYVQDTGNILNIGDHIPWNKPLDQQDEEHDDPDKTLSDHSESVSLVQHILITEDPELMVLDTATGTIQFRQLVGVLEPEVRAAQSWKGSGVLDLISLSPQAGGCYFVTDMARDTSVFDHQPYFIKLVGSEISSVGSNLAHVTAPCSWEGVYRPDSTPEVIYSSSGKAIEEVTLDAVTLYIDDDAASLLPVAARGRLGHGKFFLFESLSGEVILFIPQECDEPMVSVFEQEPLKAQGTALQIYCNTEFIYQMTEALDIFSGQYQNNNMAREIHLTHPRVTIVIANLKEDLEQKTLPPRMAMPVIQQTFSARVPVSLSGSSSAQSLDTEYSQDVGINFSEPRLLSRDQSDSEPNEPDFSPRDLPPPPPDLLEGICCGEESGSINRSVRGTFTEYKIDDSGPNNASLNYSANSPDLSSPQFIHHKPPIPHRTSSLKRRSADKNEGQSSPAAEQRESVHCYKQTHADGKLDYDASPKSTPQNKTFHLTEGLSKPTIPFVGTTSVREIEDVPSEQDAHLVEETLNADCEPVGLDMHFSYVDEDEDAVYVEASTCLDYCHPHDQSSKYDVPEGTCTSQFTDDLSARMTFDASDSRETLSSVDRVLKRPEGAAQKSNTTKRTHQYDDNQSTDGAPTRHREVCNRNSKSTTQIREKPRYKEPGESTEIQGGKGSSSRNISDSKPNIPPKPEEFRESPKKHTCSTSHSKTSQSYMKQKEENNNTQPCQKLSISEKLLSGFSDLGGVGFAQISNIEVTGGDPSRTCSQLSQTATFLYHSAFKPYTTEHFFNAKKRSPKQIQPEINLNDTFMAIEDMEWDDLPSPNQGNLVDFRPKSTSSVISDSNDSFPIKLNKSDENNLACRKRERQTKVLKASTGGTKHSTVKNTAVTSDHRDTYNSDNCNTITMEDSSRTTPTPGQVSIFNESDTPRRRSEPVPAFSGKGHTLEPDTCVGVDTSFVILSDMSNTSFDPDLSFIPAPVMRKRKRRSAPVSRTGSSLPVDVVRIATSTSVRKTAKLPYDVINSTPVDVGRYLVSSPEKLTVHLQSSSKNNYQRHDSMQSKLDKNKPQRTRGHKDSVPRQPHSQKEYHAQHTSHTTEGNQSSQRKQTSAVSHPRPSKSTQQPPVMHEVRSAPRGTSQPKVSVHKSTDASNTPEKQTTSNALPQAYSDKKTAMRVIKASAPKSAVKKEQAESLRTHKRAIIPQSIPIEKSRSVTRHIAEAKPRVVGELRDRQSMRASKDVSIRSNDSSIRPCRENQRLDNLDATSTSTRSSKRHNMSTDSKTSVSSTRSVPAARQTPQMFRAQKTKTQHSRSSETTQNDSRLSTPTLQEGHIVNSRRYSRTPEECRSKETRKDVDADRGKSTQQLKSRDRNASRSNGENSPKRGQETTRHKRAQTHLPASFTPHSYMYTKDPRAGDPQRGNEQPRANTLPRNTEKAKSSFKITNPYKLSSEV